MYGEGVHREVHRKVVHVEGVHEGGGGVHGEGGVKHGHSLHHATLLSHEPYPS